LLLNKQESRKMKIKDKVLKSVKGNFIWNEEVGFFINKALVELKADDPRIPSSHILDEAVGGTIDLVFDSVGKEIIEAYKKCYEGWVCIQSQKPRENNTPRDWEQRMDELVLLYCQLRELNYKDAEKELKQKSEIK